jgi:hypothetical protein
MAGLTHRDKVAAARFWLVATTRARGEIPNARRTYIGSTSTLSADAQNSGDGGTVIAWADASANGTQSAIRTGDVNLADATYVGRQTFGAGTPGEIQLVAQI